MNTIIPWLEHLNVLMHPGHIALVGAGNGKGIWAQWLAHQASKSRVTLIEAEPLQYSTLQRTVGLLGERAQHCELRNTVVAAQQGTASFFVANSQQESGLLEPRSLLSLWPNLQTQEVRELSAINLDALFSDLSEDVEPPMGEGNWLIIDCLPAGSLLRASSKLGLADVVIARVLLGELHSMPAGASLEEVAELLQQNGMMYVALEATRHPGIGYALFVRDARAALHAKVQQHHRECLALRLNGEKQTKLLQEAQSRIEQLAQAEAVSEQRSRDVARRLDQLRKTFDEQAKLAQERQAQVEQLTQAKAVVEKQSQERAQQLEQVGKARDEQARLAQERQAQIEQLTQAKAGTEKQSQERAQKLEQLGKARDEQTKLAQDRLDQVERLTQARAAAEKQSLERAQQLEQLGKARDEQAKLAQERHAQIEQLTQARAAAEKQSQERAQQLEQLGKARDEQAKLAQERHAQIEQLTQARVAAEMQSQERAQQLEQLTKARDEQVKLAQERQAQIEQLTQARAAAEKQSQERAQQLERLGRARDEQAKMAKESQVQIEQLAQAKAAVERQAQEWMQQLEHLAKARDEEAIKLHQGYKAQIEQLTLVNAPCAENNGNQKNEIDVLTKSLLEEKKLNDGWSLRFKDIEKKNIELEKKSEQLRKSLGELQVKSEKERKYSSDADIDDFLNDISPFFYNRSLTYVDVGAYIGEVLLKLHKSKLLKIREAHLFEPNPISYKQLENNVLEVNLNKLHTYNHALGAEDQELLLSPAKSMSKVFPPEMHLDQSQEVKKIQCRSLDGLVDLFTDRHIDLLKIDVEGYELDVLGGAKIILENQLADVIYIEVGFRRDGTQQAYFGDIDNFFQSYGYRIFKIYEQKNEWIQDSPLLRRCNFAYMSKRFAAENPYKCSLEIMRLKSQLDKFVE